MMKLADIVSRARHALDHSKARYKLGAGGAKGTAALPESSLGFCDCSGFVAWCLGESRKTANPFYAAFNGGWLETTGIYRDGQTGEGLFTKVLSPEAGDILVWPDAGGKQGHIGVITNVNGTKATRIIHCSRSNDTATGRAIRETNADVFYQKGAIAVRFDKASEV
jgi:hypothetical protein